MSDISCCGLDCSKCYCFGTMCKGCNELEGKVFHAPNGKACNIYECAVNTHKIKNCAQCKQIPCSTWRKTRDPKYSDEEFEANIRERINILNSLKED